jgi:hypothetical protein
MAHQKIKSFNQWTQQEMEKFFGLTRHSTHPTLQHWLTITLPPAYAIPSWQTELLAAKQREAIELIDSWSEQELLLRYISFILEFAHFSHERYQPFAQRPLKAEIHAIWLSGMVDFMVASGKYEPEAPYFLLHEYKRSRFGYDQDPVGQLLATMVAAQVLNTNEQPIYGAYIIGRLWYFVILEQRDYAISLPYDSTRDELYDILRILKGINILIQQQGTHG